MGLKGLGGQECCRAGISGGGAGLAWAHSSQPTLHEQQQPKDSQLQALIQALCGAAPSQQSQAQLPFHTPGGSGEFLPWLPGTGAGRSPSPCQPASTSRGQKQTSREAAEELLARDLSQNVLGIGCSSFCCSEHLEVAPQVSTQQSSALRRSCS